MTLDVTVTIANPRAAVVECGHALWIASGLDEAGLDLLRARARSEPPAGVVSGSVSGAGGAALGAELCRQYGDAAIIRIGAPAAGPARSISAWRGLSAGYDVFYRQARDSGLALSDHFRNILGTVPVAERGPAADVLCDHFLFRTVPGENTLCRSVKRLGRGEHITIGPAGGLRRTRFDRIDDRARPGSLDDYLDRLDHALQTVLEPYRGQAGAAALFSGGIDSTLIQTYLGSTVPAVCYELPWYAEDFEAGYAKRAADLFPVTLEKYPIDLTDYLHLLETTIDASALPPPHLQLVLYQTLLGLPHRQLLFGEQADALFGIELRRARLAAPFTSAAGRAALEVAGAMVPARADRLRGIREAAVRLAEAPDSLDGYGARFGVYTDWPLLHAVFGEAMVRDRLQARLEVARAMQNAGAPRSRFHQHVELAQMIDYLCEDILMCFRHQAHAFGRTMVSPFATRPVLDAALSIPAEERYLRGLQGKHLLKRLLKRRLPAYPVNQQKGYTHVPFADLYRRGPLNGVWQRYRIPDLFERKAHEPLTRDPTQMTWNAITLAIWQHRVQNNPDLRPVAGTRVFAWSRPACAAVQPDV